VVGKNSRFQPKARQESFFEINILTSKSVARSIYFADPQFPENPRQGGSRLLFGGRAKQKKCGVSNRQEKKLLRPEGFDEEIYG